jgi:uncharacterized membrane protein YhaH (DUF805 family)
MELQGSAYLYALATVSITFVGFSALLLVFRQTIGGRMTPYDAFFTLSFVQAGFIVAMGALLPPLLALYALGEETVWRISSAIAAALILAFVAAFPARRRRAAGSSAPIYVWILLAMQALAGLELASGAIGKPLGPQPASFAAAMTAMLVTSGIAFLAALSLVFREPIERR